MLKIFNLTLCFSLVFVINFLGNCRQEITRTSQAEIFVQPTPPLNDTNETSSTNNKKYYSPTKTCQKIKNTKEKSICNALVEKLRLKDKALTSEFVYAMRKIDLNKDGKKEIVAWIPNLDLGGTSGYPIIIFSETAIGYKTLLDEQDWTPIIILNSKNKNWHDIAFQVAGGGVEPHYEIFRYDGKSYKSFKTQKNQPKGEVIIKKNWI